METDRVRDRGEKRRQERAFWIVPANMRLEAVLTVLILGGLLTVFLVPFTPGSVDFDTPPAANAVSAIGPGVLLALPATPRRSDKEDTDPRGDPAQLLIGKITAGNYRMPDQVATGRFLESFDSASLLVANIDATRFAPLRRGPRFVEVAAPFWKPNVPVEVARGTARLRFVRDDGVWKLEDVKLARAKEP